MAEHIQLFSMKHIDQEKSERCDTIRRLCVQVKDDEVLSMDLEALGEQIADPFRFEIPAVIETDLSVDDPEFSRGSDQALVRFYVGVSGDGTLLRFHHNYTPLHPRFSVTVDGATIQFAVQVNKDRIGDARRQLDEMFKQVRDCLPAVARIMEIYNPQFKQVAAKVLRERHDELMKNQRAKESLAELGIPIRKRTDEVAAVFVPVSRKKLKVPDSPKTIEENPLIVEQVYEDILATINAMSHGIERSPSTFVDMDEEDIRMILLIGLNAVYEGKGTAETFNGGGRTDILIRAGDSNVFIAECAIWRGEEYFKQKIDQLIGYTMWRDSKTALVVFNRTKNLTSVVETMKSTIERHAQCVQQVGRETETSFRHLFRQLDDPQKHFLITSMAFDVP